MLGVGLAVRTAAFVHLPELTYDGTYYLRQAERLAHLRYDFAGFPPGYPLAVALVRLGVHEAVLAARLVSLLAGLATLLLFHRWARRRLAPAWALGAALLLAVHPVLVHAHVATLSESLYLLALLGGVVLFETRRDGWAGALLGFAFLVRPEALLVLLGLAAVRAARERRVPGMLLVAGLVPVLLFAALASRTVGHIVVSPKQGQLELGPALWGRLGTTLRTLHHTFPLVLVPLALWMGWRRAPHLLAPLAYLAALPLFDIHIQERLHLPALPFLLVLALLGLAALPRAQRRPALLASALFFLVSAAPVARGLIWPEPLTPNARAIGTSLRPHLHFEDRVAGRFPLVAYYAGAGFVRVQSTASYFAIVNSIAAAGATHLLVLESELGSILPQLRPLFDDARFATSEARLQGVAWVEPAAGARAILYRLQPPAVPASAARHLARDVVAPTWSSGRLLATRIDGKLFDALAGAVLETPDRIRDARADASDGVAFCTETATGALQVALLDLQNGRVRAFAATQADRPTSPDRFGRWILYVRQAAPACLRAVDVESGEAHDVRLSGLEDVRGAPLRLAVQGGEVAVTFLPARAEPPLRRVLAVFGGEPDRRTPEVQLAARWGTQQSLFDDSPSWVPETQQLLVSLAIVPPAETGGEPLATLCVLEAGGLLRRLTFEDLERPRRPALWQDRLAFVSGESELQLAPLPRGALQISPARVFSAPVVPTPLRAR